MVIRVHLLTNADMVYTVIIKIYATVNLIDFGTLLQITAVSFNSKLNLNK